MRANERRYYFETGRYSSCSIPATDPTGNQTFPRFRIIFESDPRHVYATIPACLRVRARTLLELFIPESTRTLVWVRSSESEPRCACKHRASRILMRINLLPCERFFRFPILFSLTTRTSFLSANRPIGSKKTRETSVRVDSPVVHYPRNIPLPRKARCN